jgi:hypothetical protein
LVGKEERRRKTDDAAAYNQNGDVCFGVHAGRELEQERRLPGANNKWMLN